MKHEDCLSRLYLVEESECSVKDSKMSFDPRQESSMSVRSPVHIYNSSNTAEARMLKGEMTMCSRALRPGLSDICVCLEKLTLSVYPNKDFRMW